MSFSKDKNIELTSRNMEQEYKVNIEQASVNLVRVKEELVEEELEFDENQYQVALNFENVFGESAIDQESNRDSLIGFSEGDVTMEIGGVKLEDIKEENEDLMQETIEQSHFEIIQCLYCKAWLDKQEHLESHMVHCLENYKKLPHNMPDVQRKPADESDETQGDSEVSAPIDENRCHLNQTEVIQSKQSDGIGKGYKRGHVRGKKHKCSECSYQTKRKDLLKSHLKKHKDIKQYECDICKKIFSQQGNLKTHIINQHLDKSEKEYKCSECSYQTISDYLLKLHLSTHIKAFECDICKKIFNLKSGLKKHIIRQHLNSKKIEYKCSKCSYRTNRKHCLKAHLSKHHDIKQFECDICQKVFNHKHNLRLHIRNEHSNTTEKDYKCSECSYQTNIKGHLNRHYYIHNDIKHFQCDICKLRFGGKGTLRKHIKNKHSNTTEKDYKCSECSYQTNNKGHLNRHYYIHNDIKAFECDICNKRFTLKCSMRDHIRYQHSNTSEKEYKCSQCSYQTHYKPQLKAHSNTHNDIKPFECDICKKGFNHKCSLLLHVRSQHSNTDEKEYNCPECSYQTNLKGNLTVHLYIHNNITPFECVICKRGFNQRGSLKLHMKNKHSNTSGNEIHLNEYFNTHNDKRFECDICKKRFTQKSGLNKHKRSQH